MVSKMPCGGIECVSVGGTEWVSVRHSMPLASMDPADFSRPFVSIAQLADVLERDVTGNGIDIL
jgi:hypothetical protein